MATSDTELLSKARRFLQELQAPFVGREEEALVIALALLTREHAVLIGEPGTAKSAIARRAAQLVQARFFKYLLTKFTEPSELFGPLDISALREGVYRRVTKGKLPEAEIAFLDEIFNANSAVLNALLSILQERILYDGYTEIHVPLWSMISASNRVPDEPELEALYDRLLFRHNVRPLEEDLWDKLLDAAWEIERTGLQAAEPIMSMDDLREYNKLIFSVDLSRVRGPLLRLFVALRERKIHLTDRRKGKTLKAIAAHALLNGRLVATEDDLVVLKYIAPRDLDDFEKVEIIIREEVKTKERILRELSEIEANIRSIEVMVERAREFDPRLVEYSKSLRVARNRVESLARSVEDQEVEREASRLIEEIERLMDLIAYKLNL
ncbi:MAG: MoxR family ATPase [Desulfurococcales archaeon]|nr:MoxR family ATPase [Desulfurococcales archaeon]